MNEQDRADLMIATIQAEYAKMVEELVEAIDFDAFVTVDGRNYIHESFLGAINEAVMATYYSYISMGVPQAGAPVLQLSILLNAIYDQANLRRADG